MASLQASTATSLTVDSNTVWTAATDGSTNGAGTGLDANQIAGYTALRFDIPTRIDATTTLTGGASNTFYPMVFTEDDWDAGGSGTPLIMDIRRNDPSINGAGTGRFFFKLKYRATNWGFHQNHWEVLENYGDGNGYPFIANIAQPGTSNYLAVWMRGGLTYNMSYGTRANLFDASVRSGAKGAWTGSVGSTSGDAWSWEHPNLTSSGVAPQTTLSIPTSAHYYQQHFCAKGTNLGDGSFRAANCYVVTKDLSSDQRYKDNFELSLGLEFLEKLKPVSYQWKDESNDKQHHYGFIAQEVKAVMDELGIAEQDFAGYDGRNTEHLAMDYNQFIPVVINAIQQEEETMSKLKQRVTLLEEKYGNL
jgi:hypothetical protein